MLRVCFSILFLFFFGIYCYAQTVPRSNYLKPTHKKIIDQWLLKNPKYLLATDEDCNCDNEIEYFRKGSEPYKAERIPNYHPYYIIGDFN